ncbi:MAG: molybdenum cofactor biosynthesis protein MoaE [Gemmatimonadota bacterium]
MIRSAIVTAAIDPAALLSEVTTTATGATSLFVGTVRDVNDGRAVTGIEYSAYTSMALDEMERIAQETAQQFDGIRIVIEHRVGNLLLQEISVAIAVAHARRAPAMDACRHAIEELKRRVPIWKQEHYVDGDRHWVDPTGLQSTGAPP